MLLYHFTKCVHLKLWSSIFKWQHRPPPSHSPPFIVGITPTNIDLGEQVEHLTDYSWKCANIFYMICRLYFTLSEKIFPWCPVLRVHSFLCLCGSHIIAFRSSEPLASNLQIKYNKTTIFVCLQNMKMMAKNKNKIGIKLFAELQFSPF